MHNTELLIEAMSRPEAKIMNIKMGNSADAGGGSVTECTAATSSGCWVTVSSVNIPVCYTIGNSEEMAEQADLLTQVFARLHCK